MPNLTALAPNLVCWSVHVTAQHFSPRSCSWHQSCSMLTSKFCTIWPAIYFEVEHRRQLKPRVAASLLISPPRLGLAILAWQPRRFRAPEPPMQRHERRRVSLHLMQAGVLLMSGERLASDTRVGGVVEACLPWNRGDQPDDVVDARARERGCPADRTSSALMPSTPNGLAISVTMGSISPQHIRKAEGSSDGVFVRGARTLMV